MAPISVLLIPYQGFNTLDLNGPLEVLGNPGEPPNAFTVTVAAADDLTTAAENVIIKRHISLDEAQKRLSEFDVLIQPGGPTPQIIKLIEEKSKMLDILSAFAKLPPPGHGRGERVILSICTGALFLGAAGVFSGLTATTHFLALQDLQNVCNEFVANSGGQGKPTTVVKKRYVDTGHNAAGVRVISSGGISCGLDATLYLVSERLGHDVAVNVAYIMDYAWREKEGIVIGHDKGKHH